jgi:hypothetical protein
MPAPNVAVPYLEFTARSNRHNQVRAGLTTVDPKLQQLLAELVLMRLFDEFQEAVSGIAWRLIAGAGYADGSVPTLAVPFAPSRTHAIELMQNHGRAKAIGLKWSRVSYVNENLRHIMDAQEHFRSALNSQALAISEMQAIRNRIAHSNASSRAKYAVVVKRHYGAALNAVPPGRLLLSPRFSPTLLETYISGCRAIVRACCRS